MPRRFRRLKKGCILKNMLNKSVNSINTEYEGNFPLFSLLEESTEPAQILSSMHFRLPPKIILRSKPLPMSISYKFSSL